jgi:hypothetical protein
MAGHALRIVDEDGQERRFEPAHFLDDAAPIVARARVHHEHVHSALGVAFAECVELGGALSRDRAAVHREKQDDRAPLHPAQLMELSALID